MKLVLSDISYLKKSIDIIHGLVIESRFSVTKEGIELISMDLANICFIYFKLLSSAFITYNIDKPIELGLVLSQIKDILKKSSDKDILIIEYEEPKLILTFKGKSIKKFSINTVDLEEKNIKEPTMNFNCLIKTTSELFLDLVNTCDIGKGGESVVIDVSKNNVKFSSSSTITPDKETTIECEDDINCSYSIEYLKKISEGTKLSDKVSIQLSNDYPMKVNYIVPDKVQISFILAPRVKND